MNVLPLDASDEASWEAYVRSHPKATFYHDLRWRGVMERSFGHGTHYLVAVEDGAIRGVLPIVHLKSTLFGSILCSMPFLNFGGILADKPEAESALVEGARELVRKTRAEYLELRQLDRTDAVLPARTHKVSMTLALDPDPEVLWNGLKSKHRRVVRRSLEQGLEVRFGRHELLDDFHALLSRGWRDLGTPIYRRSFFRNVLDAFGDDVEIVLVSHRGRPVGTAFDGFFRDTVEGMWTFTNRESSRFEANTFLYWQLIRRACERGYSRYHLGRSTAGSTGEFYKSKWNAEPRQLYWEYVLPEARGLPELNPDNPKFRVAIALWRRLPVWTTRAIGPFLARSIP